MGRVQLVADGGDMTVGRQMASYVYGQWKVELGEGEDATDLVEGQSHGYLYRPDDAPTGRFDLAFVRADASMDRATGRSDAEQVMETAQRRVAGDVFFERDISGRGLGRNVPGVDFQNGDLVDVWIWGKSLTLPVTAVDMLAGDASWRVHVGGQMVADAEKLRQHNDQIQAALDHERRESEKAIARVKATADSAKSTADTAKSTADTAKSTADTAKSTALEAKAQSSDAKSEAEQALERSQKALTGARESIQKSRDAGARAAEAINSASDAVKKAGQAQRRADSAASQVDEVSTNLSGLRVDVDSFKQSTSEFNDDTTATLEVLRNQIKSNRSDIEGYTHSAEQAVDEAEALVGEIKKLKLATPEERERAIRANAEATEKLSQASDLLAQASQKNQDSISKLSQAQQTHSQAISKLDEAQRQNASATRQLGQAQNATADAVGKLEKAQNQNAEATRKLSDAQAANQRADEKQQESIELLGEKTTQLGDASSQLADSQEDLQTAQSELQKAQGRVEAAQKKLRVEADNLTVNQRKLKATQNSVIELQRSMYDNANLTRSISQAVLNMATRFLVNDQVGETFHNTIDLVNLRIEDNYEIKVWTQNKIPGYGFVIANFASNGVRLLNWQWDEKAYEIDGSTVYNLKSFTRKSWFAQDTIRSAAVVWTRDDGYRAWRNLDPQWEPSQRDLLAQIGEVQRIRDTPTEYPSVIPVVDGRPAWAVGMREEDDVPSDQFMAHSYSFVDSFDADPSPFMVDGTTVYEFSFWAKASEPGAVVYLECRYTDDDSHAVQSGAVGAYDNRYLINKLSLTTEWQRYTGMLRFRDRGEVSLGKWYGNHTYGNTTSARQYIAGLHLQPIN